MVRSLVVLCFLTTFLACKKKCDNCYYFVGTHHHGGNVLIDTTCFRQYTTVRNDSIILEFKDEGTHPDTFIFSLNDRSKAYYSGQIGSKGYISNGKIFEGSKVIFRYVKDTNLVISGKNYLVCNYFYDEEHTYDVSGDYYWSPEIGIIIFGNWSHNYRLHTNNRATDSNISYIIDVINHWEEGRYSN